MCRLMFIYWKDFAEVSQNLHKKNDDQNNSTKGKQTYSWMDLLAIIEYIAEDCLGLPSRSNSLCPGVWIVLKSSRFAIYLLIH